jgi:acyl-CoA thioester hydrolase
MEGKIRVRVRYGETDCMGRAYHANYLTWFECGRVELLREEGFDYARTERVDGCYLPVFEARLKYRAPAYFDDELEVTTRIVDHSYVRLTFAYEVRRVRDDVLCAEGRTVLAAVDAQGEPRKLPEDLRAWLGDLPLPPEQERRRRK